MWRGHARGGAHVHRRHVHVRDPGRPRRARPRDGRAVGHQHRALDRVRHARAGLGEDGGIVPGLAEKWDVKPDAVTFTLRKDVTCSDGSPVTPPRTWRAPSTTSPTRTPSRPSTACSYRWA
ncbi:hypothetical protein ACFSTC_30840 [Nonomuraea ferruginea]